MTSPTPCQRWLKGSTSKPISKRRSRPPYEHGVDAVDRERPDRLNDVSDDERSGAGKPSSFTISGNTQAMSNRPCHTRRRIRESFLIRADAMALTFNGWASNTSSLTSLSQSYIGPNCSLLQEQPGTAH
jgi:hypothetical protein